MDVLRRTMLLIDARHGVKPQDEEAMAAFDARAVPYQVCACAWSGRAVGYVGWGWAVITRVSVVISHPRAYQPSKHNHSSC